MMNRIVLIVLLAGCASAGTSQPSTEAALPPESAAGRVGTGQSPGACVTGVVGIEGPGIAARPIVRAPDRTATLLEGPEAGHVRQLTAALVTVCGQAAGSGAPLVVERFELRQVDGMEAHLGTLRRTPGKVELAPREGGVPIPLGGAVDSLPAEAPMMWVAGRWAGDRFEVLSFGVLRDR